MKLARAVLPPVVATGLMIAAYGLAVQAAGAAFFDINTWFKWDGGHYFSIARTGYEFRDCAGIPGFHPGQWCGNAGWFPGYPYFVGGLHLLTNADTRVLALAVSQVFGLLSLIVVWNGFLSRRSFVLLLICAFAPGTYYFLFVFPMSMTVCFMLVTLWAQRERQYVLALLAGTIVGFTYPSGVVFSGVLATGLELEWLFGTRPPVRAWLAVLGPILGLGLVLVVHQMAVGHWNAFLLTQEKYKHGFNNPLAMLRDRATAIWAWREGWKVGLQSLLAGIMVLMTVGSAARSVWRRNSQPGQIAVAAHGLIYWLFPLFVGAGLSPYRAESLLVPATTGLPRVSRIVLVCLLLAAIAIWLIMAVEFARGSLI